MSSPLVLPIEYFSHEAYFALEQSEDHRYEYHAGEVFAMTGGTESHALISANCLVSLRNALRGKPCRVYGADMKLHIAQHDVFVYPDAQVLCEQGKRHTLYVENPALIVEVLSPTTESYDRGLKFERYRSIASLAYYLLVAQNRPHVEIYARESADSWRFSETQARIELPGLGISLDLADIYDQVEFAEAP
jgi:Uma2 family endonuclease